MLEKVLIPKLSAWLIEELPRVCDSDHATLAQYIQTLIIKPIPDDELKKLCITKLEEFLEDKTESFVESTFAWISAARSSLHAHAAVAAAAASSSAATSKHDSAGLGVKRTQVEHHPSQQQGHQNLGNSDTKRRQLSVVKKQDTRTSQQQQQKGDWSASNPADAADEGDEVDFSEEPASFSSLQNQHDVGGDEDHHGQDHDYDGNRDVSSIPSFPMPPPPPINLRHGASSHGGAGHLAAHPGAGVGVGVGVGGGYIVQRQGYVIQPHPQHQGWIQSHHPHQQPQGVVIYQALPQHPHAHHPSIHTHPHLTQGGVIVSAADEGINSSRRQVGGGERGYGEGERGGRRGGRGGHNQGRGGREGREGRGVILKAQYNRDTGKLMMACPPKKSQSGGMSKSDEDSLSSSSSSSSNKAIDGEDRGADKGEGEEQPEEQDKQDQNAAQHEDLSQVELDLEGSPDNVHLFVGHIPVSASASTSQHDQGDYGHTSSQQQHQNPITMSTITTHFSQFPGLQQVRMLSNNRAAKVTYETHDQAKTALADLNAVCGFPYIVVRWADHQQQVKNKPKHPYQQGGEEGVYDGYTSSRGGGRGGRGGRGGYMHYGAAMYNPFYPHMHSGYRGEYKGYYNKGAAAHETDPTQQDQSVGGGKFSAAAAAAGASSSSSSSSSADGSGVAESRVDHGKGSKSTEGQGVGGDGAGGDSSEGGRAANASTSSSTSTSTSTATSTTTTPTTAAVETSAKKLIDAKIALAKSMFSKVDECIKQSQDVSLSEDERKKASERAVAFKKQIALIKKEIDASRK